MFNLIKNWWLNATLQLKLIITAILSVSLLMSALSYWAINSIHQETLITDNRFIEDISLLLASNVTPLINQGNYDSLVSMSERFYSSTSSIRYIVYLDEEGEVYYNIPQLKFQNFDFIKLTKYISYSRNYNSTKEYLIYTNKQNMRSILGVTNVFVDLYFNTKHIGFLIIGLDPNPTIIDSSQIAIKISVLVFLSIWIIIVSGIIFNALSCVLVKSIFVYLFL